MNGRARSVAGASLALYLGIMASVVALPVALGEHSDLWGLIAWIVIAGVPVGVVLGWRFGPRVGRLNPIALVGWMGASAVLLGDAEVVVVIAIAGLIGGQLEYVGLAPVLYAFGLFYGLFVLPLTLAAATLWFAIFATFDRLQRRAQAKGPGTAGASWRVGSGSA